MDGPGSDESPAAAPHRHRLAREAEAAVDDGGGGERAALPAERRAGEAIAPGRHLRPAATAARSSAARSAPRAGPGGRWRGRGRRAGQLVARDLVLRDEDRAAGRAPPPGHGDRPTDQGRAARRRRLPGARRCRVRTSATSSGAAPSASWYSWTPGDGTGALHDRVGLGELLVLEPHGDAQAGDLTGLPLDQRRVRSRHRGSPPNRPVRSTSVTSCPTRGRHHGPPPAGRPPPTTVTRRGQGHRRSPVGVLGLAPARRLADAGHERVAGVAHLTRLVAAGARPDALWGAARSLATRSGRRSGLGSSRPRRTEPGRRPPTCPLGLADVDDRTLQDDRHVERLADARRQLDVEAGRLVEVGSGLLDGEDRASHDDDVGRCPRRRARRRRRSPLPA